MTKTQISNKSQMTNNKFLTAPTLSMAGITLTVFAILSFEHLDLFEIWPFGIRDLQLCRA